MGKSLPGILVSGTQASLSFWHHVSFPLDSGHPLIWLSGKLELLAIIVSGVGRESGNCPLFSVRSRPEAVSLYLNIL